MNGTLDITGGGLYKPTGGALDVNGLLETAGGTLEGGGAATILVGSDSVVDLSGSVINTGSTSLIVGANSLVITAMGFNPATAFLNYSNSAGVTYTIGTPLTVGPGQGFSASSLTINDHVYCQGAINATNNAAIYLANGLLIAFRHGAKSTWATAASRSTTRYRAWAISRLERVRSPLVQQAPAASRRRAEPIT